MIEILGIAGSLRAGSYNRGLVEAGVEHAPGGVRVRHREIVGIPLYDADEDTGDRRPDAVRAVKAAIAEADALFVATPEYNRGLAGVTKNLIDWTSRPAGESVLRGKPAGIAGVTPGPWGAVRALEQLRLALSAPQARVMPLPGLSVRRGREKFDDDGRLTDEATVDRLVGYVADLADWTEAVRG